MEPVYDEQFWRDAKYEDALAEPPMVARFRDELWEAWVIDQLVGFDRTSEFKWVNNLNARHFCQVYDPPKLSGLSSNSVVSNFVQKETLRGFQCVEFTDCNKQMCSIQQSSAMSYDDDDDDDADHPGASMLWIGVNSADPQILVSDARKLGIEVPPENTSSFMPFTVPKEVLFTTQMHLTHSQVCELVAYLDVWLETGTFDRR